MFVEPFSENNIPYIVPVIFGYRENCLYVHSAREGKKIDIIRKNNRVCFEFDTDVELVKSEKACNWSVRYYSVIGFGKAFLIDDIEEKRSALDIIMEHYSDDSYEYSEELVNNMIIIKIDIEYLTGKKSGYQ
ncbi:MAG: pyridoxamine 5'-phosphate oxidase family protein [Candidatus Jordarchaeum sp.]|uniref:pyridoxamine 5'-phosphate oxidase family protein n=1 Tax=Candidatus Jordarchaeum sp. TaxID=2823881 RepID=UPI00404ABD29